MLEYYDTLLGLPVQTIPCRNWYESEIKSLSCLVNLVKPLVAIQVQTSNA